MQGACKPFRIFPEVEAAGRPHPKGRSRPVRRALIPTGVLDRQGSLHSLYIEPCGGGPAVAAARLIGTVIEMAQGVDFLQMPRACVMHGGLEIVSQGPIEVGPK
jgi:hypothetical protein